MSRHAGSVPEENQTRLLQSAVLEFSEFGFKASAPGFVPVDVTTGALYFFFRIRGFVRSCDFLSRIAFCPL